VQKELGLTMHAPAWCRGRRGVRLVGLAHSGVVDERPLAAVVLVADEKVKGRRAAPGWKRKKEGSNCSARTGRSASGLDEERCHETVRRRYARWPLRAQGRAADQRAPPDPHTRLDGKGGPWRARL